MTKAMRVAVAVVVLGLAGAARAEVPAGYVTVDEVGVGAATVSVTGLAAGAATPSTQTFTMGSAATVEERAAGLDACHRALLLALAKPGQYAVQLGFNICRVRLLAP